MKKPVYLLVGILFIFLIIYFLLLQKEKKTFSPRKVENFLQLDSALVDRIEFGKFDTRLILQKIKGRWYIVEPDSFRADNNAVGQLLGLASRLEVGEVISSNREKQFLFQVDTLTGTRVNFLEGERSLASLVVGKTSKDYLHAYLRKMDSDDVYLTDVSFSRMVNRGVNQWRDRLILAFDPQQVKEIELNTGRKRFKLTREDTLWLSSRYPYRKSSPADVEAVEKYLKTVARIRADDFAQKSEEEKIDFQKPEFSLRIVFQDGHEEKLFATRKNKEDSRWFVKNDQEKSVYILYQYSFNRLNKNFDDFQLKEKT